MCEYILLYTGYCGKTSWILVKYRFWILFSCGLSKLQNFYKHVSLYIGENVNIGFWEKIGAYNAVMISFCSMSWITYFSSEIRTNYFRIYWMWHLKLKCEQQTLVSRSNGCTGNNRYIVRWTGTVGRLMCSEIKGENIRIWKYFVTMLFIRKPENPEKYRKVYFVLKWFEK